MIVLKRNSSNRKIKSKFIHAPDNWKKCIVTKSGDKLIFEKKSDFVKEKLIKSAFDSNDKFTHPNNHYLPLNIYDKTFGYLSKPLLHIYEAIEKSKYILDLKENWDDENAIAYDLEVWKKAIIFISKLSSKILKSYGQIIRSPKIYHGPKGSIDIYWENDDFNLLINIPPVGLGTFYGDNYENAKSEGHFDPITITATVFPFIVEFK